MANTRFLETDNALGLELAADPVLKRGPVCLRAPWASGKAAHRPSVLSMAAARHVWQWPVVRAAAHPARPVRVSGLAVLPPDTLH